MVMIEMEQKAEIADVPAVVTTTQKPPPPVEVVEGKAVIELQPTGYLPSLRSILSKDDIAMSIGADRIIGELVQTHKGPITIRRAVIKSFVREGMPFPLDVSLHVLDRKDKHIHRFECPTDEYVLSNCNDTIGFCVLPRKFQQDIVLCTKERQVSRNDKLSLKLAVLGAPEVLSAYVNQKDSNGRPVRTDADFERDTVDLNFRVQIDFVVAKA